MPSRILFSILGLLMTGWCSGLLHANGPSHWPEATQKERSVDRSAPPPTQPQEQFVTRETGFYHAPPRVGVQQGAARSFGLHFGSITIPEIRLGLPAIELPSLYRVQQPAKMRVAASEAAWVSTGYQRSRAYTEAEPPQTTGDRGAPPKGRSATSDECEQLRQEYENKIRELNRKLEECEALKRSLQELSELQKMSLSHANDAQTLTHGGTPPESPPSENQRQASRPWLWFK